MSRQTSTAAGSPDAVTVVGIGADGWPGLPDRVREIVLSADVLLGGERHLGLVPDGTVTKVSWPKPFHAGLRRLLGEYRGRRLVVLASGDPLVSGVGSTIVDLLGAASVHIVPAVSSVALARARLGWPAETVEVVSVVGRDIHRVTRALAPGRRVLVLSSDGTTPTALARLLAERGYGSSRMAVLENLGAADERRVDGVAGEWDDPPVDALNVVAVECVLDAGATPLPALPGLPDDAFEHDGQITKRDLRAGCLARLMPLPGQLLWDVGAGSGSVAVEWMRAHPANRAVAVEARADRASRLRLNAERLGVPDLQIVEGRAPEALRGVDPAFRPPDAVFVGGGVSADGVLDACLDALVPGGRLVAHAVTLESEGVLADAYRRHGGELTRISLERAGPLGGFTGWEPARTLIQWSLTKERL